MQSIEEIRDNIALTRFELAAGGELAIVVYQNINGTITFTHTVVPLVLRGRGMGGRLIAGALATARAAHLKVIPQCSFVAAYIDKHPDSADLAIIS